MTCRELVDFLMDYLDGELADDPRRVFEEHIGFCPPCKAYLDTYRATMTMGKSACSDPEGPVPDDVPERLVEAILAARKQLD